MEKHLKVKNATFIANENKKISNVSFDIKKGEIVCLLGPSGAGKTTILRTIAGLIDLNDGEIILKNKLLSSKNFTCRPQYRNIALSFQENSLFPHINVKENIELGIKNNIRKRFAYSTDDLIKIFQLKNLKNKYPHEISSGEAQRVSIARSLMSNPELLLLDEPFSNIDQSLRNEIQIKIKEILKETKISTIIVTHDSNEAFYLGDKCGVIINNKLKQYDTPYNIYHFPNSEEIVNFLKRGTLLDVKVLGLNKLKHSCLGIINGKFACSNLNKLSYGKIVKLLIQPDDLSHDDKSKLKLEIVDRHFRGTNFIYSLKTQKNEILPVLVDSHHQHLHENDESFGVKIPILINHLVCFEI